MPKLKLKRRNKKKTTSPTTSLTDRITEKYMAFKKSVKQVEQTQLVAFDRMFQLGETLIAAEEEVKKTYGSWSSFATDRGLSASTLSRCKASVADFKRHGATTLELARELLNERGLTPTAKLMEQNINRLLTDGPPEKTPPKQQSVKAQKHINELRSFAERAEEIVEQHDPDEEIYKEAKHVVKFMNESVEHLDTLRISQKKWNSQTYLDFCRRINYDVVLGRTVDKTEPMHISPTGDFGSSGGKVADFYAIPGCRDTHNKLDNNGIEFDEDDIAHWHRWTMAMFLYHTIASDKTNNVELADYEEVTD